MLDWLRTPPTTASIVSLRGIAASIWESDTAAMRAETPKIPRRLPGYFVDRYALELHSAIPTRSPLTQHARPGRNQTRSEYLASCIRPCRSLDNWTPVPEDQVTLSGLYDTLASDWARLVVTLGGTASLGRLPDAREGTWGDLFDQTVFYPGPPVFRGATFFDELSLNQQAEIFRIYGRSAPIDFFAFMMQVHETIHSNQTGEPLLNEFVQACLWMLYVETYRLWIFQENNVSGAKLVRENQLVNRFQWARRAVEADLDTATLISSESVEGAYFICCLAAYCFDRGAFTYAGYLAWLETILAARKDRAAIKRMHNELSNAANYWSPPSR